MRLRLFAVIVALASARGELPFSPAEGTTWHYAHAEQTSDAASGSDAEVVVRIAGMEEFNGQSLLKFETLTGDSLTKTELLEVSDRGIFCHARSMRNEELAKVDPPETVVPWPLKVGASWETDGMAADVRMHQRFSVLAEEDVYVPAGKFQAFHLHCDGTALMAISIDRWFVPGVGFVREVTTMRGPGGVLLQRSTIELARRPEVVALPTSTARPSEASSPTDAPAETSATAERRAEAAETSETPADEASSTGQNQRLTVEVSADAAGGMQTEFKSNVKNIYVRWHGHGLPKDARVRVAWVAEDVGDLVDPNFVVDETESVAPAPDASARFTLGRPEDGWAEGKYRVEFYVNDELAQSVRVRIVK